MTHKHWRVVGRVLSTSLLFAISLSLAGLVYAQTKNGNIIGQIADPAGALVPGITVTAVNETTQAQRKAVTASDDTYLFSLISAGEYTLTVEHAGFKKYVNRDVSLSVNQCLRVDVKLEIGEITSTVDVTGESESWRTLVDGKSLDGWQAQDPSQVHDWQTAKTVIIDPQDDRFFVIQTGKGIFVNGKTGKTQNLVTKEKFGDVEVHVEFTLPHKSNSGIFLMGLYEVQVQDDYATKDLLLSNCGGFYARKVGEKWIGGTPPRVNACKPPGIWQTFDIKFRAPHFDAKGSKIENARFPEVRHNGVLIHANVEMEGPNSAHMPIPEAPTGPLMLQGDHGPIAYRNVRIRPLQ